ncbi:hypothetical protein VTI74DRAFT_8859 [Chaetomium olivicolor]
MRSSLALLLSGLATHVVAKTIPVLVGRNGLTFEPNEIIAENGDVIEFRFWPKNHSVVAGHFAQGCRPSSSEAQRFFYTGFFPTQQGVNSQVFRYTVKDNKPLPIYCSQNTGKHCKNGMVAVINPDPSQDYTLDAYVALSSAADEALGPVDGFVTGGEIVPLQGSGASSSDSYAGTATTTTVTERRSKTVSTKVTGTATETETETATQSESGTATETVRESTTAAGSTGGVANTTTTAATTTATGNVAAGLGAPVAGLLAVAVGALFV